MFNLKKITFKEMIGCLQEQSISGYSSSKILFFFILFQIFCSMHV